MSGERIDYGALLKESFDLAVREENLLVLLAGALAVTIGSAFSFGLLAGPLSVSYALICLNVARGDRVDFQQLQTGFSALPQRLLAGVIYLVAIAIGSMFLGLPGMAFGIAASFLFHVMAEDEEIGAIDALRKSFELVRSRPVPVLVVWLMAMILGGLMSITVVGTIPAVALYFLLSAFVYRFLVDGAPLPTQDD